MGTDDVDASFRTFVGDQRPELLRTALLLTGGRTTAEELVQRVTFRSGADWPGAGPRPGARVTLPTPLRPGADVADARLVDAALTGLAVPLGVEPQALEPELLWSTRLPGSRPAGSVVVVLAHSPGGGLVVTTWAGGTGAMVGCGVQTPPGNTDVDGITVARTCAVPSLRTGPPAEDSWLVVTAPPAAATAKVLDRRGRVLDTLPLTGGGVVGRDHPYRPQRPHPRPGPG